MKKIPTLLVRDPDDRAYVIDEVTPGCEWVLRGEGLPTRKYDGTCVMLDDDGRWWARREVKRGKAYPENYVPEQEDLVTGKTVGWEPIAQSPFVKFFDEAIVGMRFRHGGTFELCGPKINGNPENLPRHALISHEGAEVMTTPLANSPDVATIKMVVANAGKSGWEGIVWHHPDGRMAKLKARDIKQESVDARSEES